MLAIILKSYQQDNIFGIGTAHNAPKITKNYQAEILRSLKQGYLSGQGLLPTISSDDNPIKMPSDHFDGLLTAMYG
jgi:hypothetical protein